MNGDVTAALNLTAEVIGEHLWRGCWQGGLVLALVWGAIRLFPHSPPDVRCWLWRLAHLKLLVALVWGGASVELPVLPAAQMAGNRPPATGTAHRPEDAPYGPAERWMAGSPAFGLSPVSAQRESGNAGVAKTPSPHTRPGAALVLILVWLVGVSWHGVRTAREWQSSRRLLRTGVREAEGPLVEQFAWVCARFALPQAPRLGLSEAVGSPVLVGAARPTILLPPSLLEVCTTTDLRLVLAHELAHLKRCDLLWAWLPAAAGGLFFFHPLVWLAGRDGRLAQEMACDELAVRVTGAPALEYGQMVLKIASQRRAHGYGEPAVASATGAYQNLRRRLTAIQQIRPRSSRRRRLFGVLLMAVGIVITVPWRATARADGSQPRSLPREQRQAEAPERLRRQSSRTHQEHIAEQERLRLQEAQAHERRVAEQEWIRQQEVQAHHQRVAELERLRRQAIVAHQRRLAEQEQRRRVVIQAHELRLAEQEQAMQLADEAHQRRLAEQENLRQLALRAHQRREAEVEQRRLMEKLAHEQRLAHQEHVRRMATAADRQRQAARDDIRDLEKQMLRHRRRAQLTQQELVQQQRQMAATRDEMQALARQLRELRMQQQALETRRQQLEALNLRQRAMEHALQLRLQRSPSRAAPRRSRDRQSSP
jgi:beta-lactamase regulating signal transducer with metallopeptidase domain